MGSLGLVSCGVLLLAQVAGLAPEHAEISGSRWSALNPEPPATPELAWAQHRQLRLRVEKDGVVIDGRWTLLGQGGATPPRYFLGVLLPADARISRATWDGQPASLWTSGEREVTIAGRVGDRSVLEVEAFVPGDAARGLDLDVLGATSGTTEIAADFPVELSARDGTPVLPRGQGYSTGSAALRIGPRHPAAVEKGTIAVARTALGLTVGDDAVVGHGWVNWIVRRGSLATVALRARGVGQDLEVTGPNVARWRSDGDRVVVELKSPAVDSVWIRLSWTKPIATGAESSMDIPSLAPEDALSTEATLELARDGEVDAAPQMASWSPIAPQQLPDWSRGLTRGTPTATYRRADAGAEPSPSRLELYRFEPLPGPEVVVDIADLTVSTSTSGRELVAARYELTNERADALEISLPRGAELVGAWVAGQPTAVAQREGRLRIPLARSIETVNGLLSFPVTVGFVGESKAWKRRERRSVPLPRVHAPVNVERITLRLPREYHSQLDPERDDPVVSEFSRGDEVAYGLTDPDLIATADVIYHDAIAAWNANEFDRARQRLGELSRIGAKSENQEGLEGNVILLTGPLAGAPAVGRSKKAARKDQRLTERERKERRIREQAKARSGDARERQRTHKKQAQAYKAAGDYEAAAAEYEQALEETKELRNLDADESYGYAYEADQLESEILDLENQAENREELEYQSKLWGGGPFASASRTRPAPPIHAVAPLVIPNVGETVLYQLVLLEPGAERSVPIHAKKRSERHRRKESAR